MDSIQYLFAGSNHIVPVADIIAFKAEDKYTTVILDRATAIIDPPLIALERDLKGFVRINRNLLINRDRIESFRGKFRKSSVIAGGNEYPCSRRHYREIRDMVEAMQ